MCACAWVNCWRYAGISRYFTLTQLFFFIVIRIVTHFVACGHCLRLTVISIFSEVLRNSGVLASDVCEYEISEQNHRWNCIAAVVSHCAEYSRGANCTTSQTKSFLLRAPWYSLLSESTYIPLFRNRWSAATSFITRCGGPVAIALRYRARGRAFDSLTASSAFR